MEVFDLLCFGKYVGLVSASEGLPRADVHASVSASRLAGRQPFMTVLVSTLSIPSIVSGCPERAVPLSLWERGPFSEARHLVFVWVSRESRAPRLPRHMCNDLPPKPPGAAREPRLGLRLISAGGAQPPTPQQQTAASGRMEFAFVRTYAPARGEARARPKTLRGSFGAQNYGTQSGSVRRAGGGNAATARRAGAFRGRASRVPGNWNPRALASRAPPFMRGRQSAGSSYPRGKRASE